MSFLSSKPGTGGGGGGGAFTAVTGTPTEVAYFDALGNGTGSTLFTVNDVTNEIYMGREQNMNVDIAGITISDDIIPFFAPNVPGWKAYRKDVAGVVGQVFISLVDGTAFGGTSSYVGIMGASGASGDSFFSSFQYDNYSATMESNGGTLVTQFQIGVDRISQEISDGTDTISTKVEFGTGLGTQTYTMSYDDGTLSNSARLGATGFRLQSGADSYTFPLGSPALNQVLGRVSANQLGFVDSTSVLKTTISSAQVLTLNSAPVTIIPSPGVGKAIQILGITIRNSTGTTPYVGNQIFAFASLSAGSPLYLSNETLADFTALPLGSMAAMTENNPTGSQMSENKAVGLSITGADPSVGNGTLDVYTTYQVITL